MSCGRPRPDSGLDVLNVRAVAPAQVVHADDILLLAQERLDEMRTDKAGRSRDKPPIAMAAKLLNWRCHGSIVLAAVHRCHRML